MMEKDIMEKTQRLFISNSQKFMVKVPSMAITPLTESNDRYLCIYLESLPQTKN